MDWDGNELLLSDILGSDEDDVSRDLEKNEEKKTIRDAIRGLDEREQVIINLRYGLNGGKRAHSEGSRRYDGNKPVIYLAA